MQKEKIKKAYIELATIKCQLKHGIEIDREKLSEILDLLGEMFTEADKQEEMEYKIHPRDRDNLRVRCDVLAKMLNELENHHKKLTGELCMLEDFKCRGIRGQKPDFILLEQIVDRMADAVREIRHYMISSQEQTKKIKEDVMNLPVQKGIVYWNEV